MGFSTQQVQTLQISFLGGIQYAAKTKTSLTVSAQNALASAKERLVPDEEYDEETAQLLKLTDIDLSTRTRCLQHHYYFKMMEMAAVNEASRKQKKIEKRLKENKEEEKLHAKLIKLNQKRKNLENLVHFVDLENNRKKRLAELEKEKNANQLIIQTHQKQFEQIYHYISYQYHNLRKRTRLEEAQIIMLKTSLALGIVGSVFSITLTILLSAGVGVPLLVPFIGYGICALSIFLRNLPLVIEFFRNLRYRRNPGLHSVMALGGFLAIIAGMILISVHGAQLDLLSEQLLYPNNMGYFDGLLAANLSAIIGLRWAFPDFKNLFKLGKREHDHPITLRPLLYTSIALSILGFLLSAAMIICVFACPTAVPILMMLSYGFSTAAIFIRNFRNVLEAWDYYRQHGKITFNQAFGIFGFVATIIFTTLGLTYFSIFYCHGVDLAQGLHSLALEYCKPFLEQSFDVWKGLGYILIANIFGLMAAKEASTKLYHHDQTFKNGVDKVKTGGTNAVKTIRVKSTAFFKTVRGRHHQKLIDVPDGNPSIKKTQ